MRIAVNEADGLMPAFVQMAALYPEDTLLFLCSDSAQSGFPYPNMETVAVKNGAFGWRGSKLPRLLEKLEAEAYISPGRLPSEGRIPSCLVIPALEESRPLRKDIRRAAVIITFSEKLKEQLQERYRAPEEKIRVIPVGTEEAFRPLSWEEQEAVKGKYTEGREYLCCTGAFSGEELLNLLKAFSLLKKKLQSNICLLLPATGFAGNRKLQELLATFRFRNDVKLTEAQSPEARAAIAGAAYACVLPAMTPGVPVSALEALKSHVPVIGPAGMGLEEFTGAAALYFEQDNSDEMGDALYRLYKDERQRERLTARCAEQSARFTWHRCAAAFRESVAEAVAVHRKTA